MKNSWLKAVVLAVSMVAGACGGTQEPVDETPSEQGGVEQQLPQCDTQGRCSPGFYCDGGPGGTCRRNVVELPYQCTTEGKCPTGYFCDGGPGGICRRELARAE